MSGTSFLKLFCCSSVIPSRYLCINWQPGVTIPLVYGMVATVWHWLDSVRAYFHISALMWECISLGYVNMCGPSDLKISDQTASSLCSSATNSSAFCCHFMAQISPISMGLISAMAALVVFDVVSAWKPCQEWTWPFFWQAEFRV